ncbi:MAG: uL15m family ribosomal protein [Candidatus Micrarchaeia archaeon]|jgi:large subunit ribosomal protein L15
MVLRIKKKVRKYLGNRRWGAGNIKNNRGAGDRGGVGRGGVKHKFTYIVVYERERIRSKGFFHLKKKMKEINLGSIDNQLKKLQTQGGKPTVELTGFKVLGSGKLTIPAIIKASAFSKGAEEKIRKAGGEAIVVTKAAETGMGLGDKAANANASTSQASQKPGPQ